MKKLVGRRLLSRVFAMLLAAAMVAAACGDDADDEASADDMASDDMADDTADDMADDDMTGDETPAEETPAEEAVGEEPVMEEEPVMGADGLPLIGTAERCEANRSAGKLIFQTGFDYAAAAGIIEIIAAKAEGFFDEMCLEVELQPGFAPGNSTSLAAGLTQLSVAASFGELVRLNVAGGTDMMAFSQLGHTSVSALVVPAGAAESLADLDGKIIGIKGDIPAAVEAMLAQEGIRREDITELLLDGFDPVAHLALGIDALPVYKSNEPAVLEREGIDVILFDPLDYDIPASFALAVNTPAFYEEHPTVVEDFVRAQLRGYQFAAENPEAAVSHAFDLINAAGNPMYLAEAHELSRWRVEQSMVQDVTPEGFLIGQLNPEALGAEVQLLTDLGVFETLPDWEAMIDTALVPRLYDDSGDLIWASMN